MQHALQRTRQSQRNTFLNLAGPCDENNCHMSTAYASIVATSCSFNHTLLVQYSIDTKCFFNIRPCKHNSRIKLRLHLYPSDAVAIIVSPRATILLIIQHFRCPGHLFCGFNRRVATVGYLHFYNKNKVFGLYNLPIPPDQVTWIVSPSATNILDFSWYWCWGHPKRCANIR